MPSMNEELIEDLKQFITATISQQLSLQLGELHEEISGIRTDMSKMEQRLSGQMKEISDSVAEAMTNTNEEVDKQIQDHEKRITKLETKSA